MVAGKLGAVTEKLALDTFALFRVTAAEPELVEVTVRVFVAPATTLPKSMLAFASERVRTCRWVFGGLQALSPWRPARKERPNKSINSCAVFQDFFAPPWVERRAGEFGVIGGHEPPPLQSCAKLRLGGGLSSSVDLCSPIEKVSEVHTFCWRKANFQNRDWPNMTGEWQCFCMR